MNDGYLRKDETIGEVYSERKIFECGHYSKRAEWYGIARGLFDIKITTTKEIESDAQ